MRKNVVVARATLLAGILTPIASENALARGGEGGYRGKLARNWAICAVASAAMAILSVPATAQHGDIGHAGVRSSVETAREQILHRHMGPFPHRLRYYYRR
jgi:hypothetical protein